MAALNGFANPINQSDTKRLVALAKVHQAIFNTDTASGASCGVTEHCERGLLSFDRFALTSNDGKSKSHRAFSKICSRGGTRRAGAYLASKVVIPLSMAASTPGSHAKGSSRGGIARKAFLGRVVARIACAIGRGGKIGASITDLGAGIICEHGGAAATRVDVALGRLLALAWPFCLGSTHLGLLANNGSTPINTEFWFTSCVHLGGVEHPIFV